MTFFANRRVALCGGHFALRSPASRFCDAIGEQLASHPNIILQSLGVKRGYNSTGPDDCAAEYHIISSATRFMLRKHREVRIETFVNAAADAELFLEGRVLPAHGRSRDARRFYIVSKADALIAISGSTGTEQQLALANAFDLPILPIPTFGGASRDFWLLHQEEICSRLRLTSTEAKRLEEIAPSAEAAQEFISVLISTLERRCFVIMPFANEAQLNALYDRAIATAVRTLGDRPIRLDREGLPGDVGDQIQEGIATCDYAIAVFDRQSLNVCYELGLAHAQRKPVIIVCNNRQALSVPFDISMHQRIDYDVVDDQLAERISNAIAACRQRL